MTKQTQPENQQLCANCGSLKFDHHTNKYYCDPTISKRKFTPQSQDRGIYSPEIDKTLIELEQKGLIKRIPQNQNNSQDNLVEKRDYQSDPSTKQDKPMKSDKGVLPVSPDSLRGIFGKELWNMVYADGRSQEHLFNSHNKSIEQIKSEVSKIIDKYFDNSELYDYKKHKIELKKRLGI